MGIWYHHKALFKERIMSYTGDCPPYYDLKGTPWFDDLNNNLPEIKKRAIELLSDKKLDLQRFNVSLVDEGVWESQSFLVCNVIKKLSKGKGKELFDLFKDMPGVISVFISVLNPHTHVKAHYGDTDASYRLHIPIVIPGGVPECGIKVGGVTRSWPEDEILVFCDAHMHEVWDHTDKKRVILIVDIIKPEYRSQTTKICNEVMSWLFMQKVAGAPVINRLPIIMKVPIAFIALIIVKPFFSLLQRQAK